MANAWWEPLTFEPPSPDGGQERWHRWIDTSRPTPEGIVPADAAPALEAEQWTVPGRSLTVLLAGLNPPATAGDDHPDRPPAAPAAPR